MKVMAFNMQKDRNHSVQFQELLHFMDRGEKQHVDLMVLNEAYFIHPEVQHAATVSGYGAFHPNMVRGQNWNAVLWDLDWWKCIDTEVLRLTDHGYQNTPPRYAAKTLLEATRGPEKGERVLLYGLHYPPSWQWGIKTPRLVRDRVALAKQMDVAMAQEVRKARREHPRAHVMVAGDFNCSSLNASNPYYPASFYPRSLNPVSYTHLTLPTMRLACRSRWSPYH